VKDAILERALQTLEEQKLLEFTRVIA